MWGRSEEYGGRGGRREEGKKREDGEEGLGDEDWEVGRRGDREKRERIGLMTSLWL